MKISAHIANQPDQHELVVSTNGNEQRIAIPARAAGGSSVNGGEMLFAALATCYCNDIYREAKKRGIVVRHVTVDVEGEFGAEGEPARNVVYRARVEADATPEQIGELLRHTDAVAEIQASLRNGVRVTFES